MTYSCMWHDSITCVTWLIHTWIYPSTTTPWQRQSRVSNMKYVTWLIHMWDMTHSYWEMSFIDGLAAPKSSFKYKICNMTHSCLWPRVEWRGLKIEGGNLIHRQVVFCIFRCQSIEWESLAIIWVAEYFGEITNSQTKWHKLSCGKGALCCA